MHYLITLLLLLLFFRLGVLGEVIHKLALSQWEVHYGMLLLILLSLVNIRLFDFVAAATAAPVGSAEDAAGDPPAAGRAERTRVAISLNLGGVVVPLLFGLYFSRAQWPAWPALALLIGLVALVVYPCSRVSRRRGVVIHLAAAVLVAALGGLWLGGDDYLVWAYLAAMLGTLIGGDLLHLSALLRQRGAQQQGVFIGGAGLMDAIFLAGLFAMLTAELLHQHDLFSTLS